MVEKDEDTPEYMIRQLIGNRWMFLIIRSLLDGTKRFGELKKLTGDISQKVLTSNLKSLEDYGLLVRKVYAQIPPRVEYTLTAIGEDLRPIIESALKWSSEYNKKISE